MTILAGIGRYGAWLKLGATGVTWLKGEDVLAVALRRTVSPVVSRTC